MMTSKTDATASNPIFTDIIAWRHGETYANKEHSLSGAATVGSKFNLNETGQKQAAELAKQVFSAYPELKFVYSSDLPRALETAKIVASQYRTDQIELIKNAQLRETYHGEFEGGSDEPRNQAAEEQCSKVPKLPIADKYQFWRFHPVTKKSVNDDVQVRDIAKAIEEKDPTPETVYELHRRAMTVFKDIAKKHGGMTIAVSSHGGFLGTLAEALRYEGKEVVLPPYYVKAQHIASDGKVIMPAASKVGNCALLKFRYYHDTEKLELLS